MDEPDNAPPAQHDAFAWLVLGNLLALVLVTALSAVSLDASRAAFMQRALDATENLARGLQQNIAAHIGRIDMALQTIALTHAQQLARGAIDPAAFAKAIDEQQAIAAEVDSLRVTDAAGVVRYGRGVAADTRADVSDRDYFVRARELPSPGLIVSEPLFARIGKRWGIVVARRLNHPDGSFAGVVYAGIGAEHFERLFATVKLGPQGAICLRSASLRLIARHTGRGEPTVGHGTDNVSARLRDAIRASPLAGTYIARTALDEIERANSYQRVGDYPLLVLVGLATDDYLAPWRTEVAQVTILALLAALVLLSSSVLVYRAWRRASASSRALIREGDRHRAFMLTASDGIHVLDRSGTLIELSDSFAGMLGRPRAAMLGMHVSLWDAQLPAAAQLLQDFRIGERIEWATRHRRSDGSVIEVDIVSVGVRIEGRELLCCSARDVTERKRAERALRASETSLDRTGRIAGVGGWEMDLASGAIYWSDQTCRIHEVEPGFRPSLQQAIEFQAPEARDAIDAAFREAIRNGTPWDLELPLRTARNRAIWVHTIGEVECEDERPVRLIGAVQDITERRMREAELQREQAQRSQIERHAQELDALLHERSEMLDVMAHEVRQPLNNASAALQSASTALAEAGENTASLRLTRAQNVMGQVLARIDNTLAVASLLARSDLIERGDTDIDTLVAVVIADMPANERGRVRVERVTATRTASMDMSLMRLALRNLLSNALNYSPAGAPVRVRLTDSDEPLALVIEVLDAGGGVEPELVPRLFERGTRGRRRGGPPGHGLGLYIVRRVMELHGGRVELAGNSAGGATLRLVIEQAPGD